jgi:hypothetical protein
VKREPTIDAVAFVLPGKPGSDALLVAMRDGSVIERVNDGESFVADANCEFPPDGAGFWLWRDTGSTIVPPDQYNEDGGVAWEGRWVRPSLLVGFSLVAGRMPWDEASERSTIEAERNALVDRVAELEAEVDGLRCDIQGSKPVVPELPPLYSIDQEPITEEWCVECRALDTDLESFPVQHDAITAAWGSFREHDTEWADFIDSLR